MRTMKKLLLICLCAALLLAGCGKEKDPPASTGAPMTYTVSVCTAGGMGLEDVTVYIYEDSTLQELVSVVKTDAVRSSVSVPGKPEKLWAIWAGQALTLALK